jgi:pimeloyl-ACP methyl ester carboxylesterase
MHEARATVLGREATFLRSPARGPASPIVLLHGAGGSHRSFDELVAALAGEDVIVPSLPGRGGSEGPAPATAAEAAGFVRALLAAIGVDRFTLAGHSYGGAVALELALAGESGLDGLLLIASGARLRVHPAILERARAAAAGDGPPVDLRAAFLPGTAPDLVARFEARLAGVPAAAVLADWTATNAFDRLGALGGLRVPLLALVGDGDALTPPRNAQFFADKVPGARAMVVAGAGHMLPIEQPAAVVEALATLRRAVP